jgi:hypothetical protein
MRKAELLLACDLSEMALSKAWTDLMAEDRDITLLAYTALQVEARRPGTVPQELLASLSAKVSPEKLSTKCIAHLEGDAVEYVDKVDFLLKQDDDLSRMIAYQRVSELVDAGNINPNTLETTRRAIEMDIERFNVLVQSGKKAVQTKGGMAA